MGVESVVKDPESKVHNFFVGHLFLLFLLSPISHVFGSSPIDELTLIQTRAFDGDPHYQGVLAMLYKYGEKNLPVDIGESKRWAKLSAEKDGGIGLATLAAIELEEGKVQRGQFLYDEAYLHSNLRFGQEQRSASPILCRINGN